MFTPQDHLPLPLQIIVTALHALPPILNSLEDDKRLMGYLSSSQAWYFKWLILVLGGGLPELV